MTESRVKRFFPTVKWIGWKAAAAVVVLLLLATTPWWGVRMLSHLSYFHVRRVEVVGQQYLQPRDVLTRLRVDTNVSIWTDLSVLQKRVASHPQVRSVQIERKLPGTLVVQVTETRPLAFVPSTQGLMVVDSSGHTLPIDPSRISIDLPVVARSDTGVLRVLADVRGRKPALFSQISSVRRAGPDEITFALDSLVVRTTAGVTAERLADIFPVEQDLARRRVRAAELDLRFRDQVIARLQ